MPPHPCIGCENLRVQLQQAQEEIDRLRDLVGPHEGHILTRYGDAVECESCRQNPPWNARGVAAGRELVAERDAAIKRMQAAEALAERGKHLLALVLARGHISHESLKDGIQSHLLDSPAEAQAEVRR